MMTNTTMDKKYGLFNTIDSPISSFFDSLSLSLPLPLSSALLSLSAVPGLPPIPDVLSVQSDPMLLTMGTPEAPAKKE